jgi:branched-chain amino acid transport system permease protein
MLDRILSHDRRAAAGWPLALHHRVGLAAGALPVPRQPRPLSVAAKALVFILLVASFDLLLGYTGIVSFAHTMFFGIGAYGVAIASTRMGRAGPRWPWARRRRWSCRWCCRW